ncbi:MAG: serine protease, partial [Nitrososphaeraceae archaeon]|nr:serine protease [Nitrososphaeraceae archaeon]
MHHLRFASTERAIVVFIIIMMITTIRIVVLPIQRTLAVAAATTQPISPMLPTQSSSMSLTNIFKQAQNSIVLITAPPIAKNQNVSLGAGFIYDKNGHILTAADVLEGTKPPIDIMFSDGNFY